jgi:hypothetical protein
MKEDKDQLKKNSPLKDYLWGFFILLIPIIIGYILYLLAQ